MPKTRPPYAPEFRQQMVELVRAGRSAEERWLMSASGVRRGKAALFQWVQIPPGDRSSRKQPEQSWR